ncbi:MULTISPECIES: S41 family peptidase [unclassified Micromonospora]|uniref:S41 family peptidase n=1 Tax=unclassified Micromonospora TaxID=2617518 RepID=UPI001B39C7CB|nr:MULTISPECIES: S41 family peptidase [unclassified Micromonospora]MBQ1046512.1 S41 family peptidase [Micromonospora sp. C72]MBQ1058170.1 S41 family peptidase [Micromonospora sp. C32]
MDPDEITGIVERAAGLVADEYVLPDVADRVAAHLRARLGAGAYAGAGDPAALGALVTADLQSVNGDLHLRLKHHEQQLSDKADDPAGEHFARLAALGMGGVTRVQRLPGNVGLLEIQPYVFPPDLAGDALTAALRLLAGTDALLLDLRGTEGGSPDGVALLLGWFFAEPVHLHTMHERSGAARQFWSAAWLPVPRYAPDKPVHVLTGPVTFSGGEEVAYDLQQFGRATLVGERTRGGAHPRVGHRLHPHLELTVPVARPVNAVSGTNWEGCGVVPDVEAPVDRARDVAYRRSLEALLTADPGRPTAAEARAALAALG